jgi:hypothetical protein
MPGNYPPSDGSDLPSAEPLDDRGDRAREIQDDEPEPGGGADDREHSVARRPNPLPNREEEEEELADADILQELDLDDFEDPDGRGA